MYVIGLNLATVSSGGQPSVRMVLLKYYDAAGFVFYTNLGSRKAEEMRLRAVYRRRAMNGEFRGIPIRALRSFTGPDCAYHLYSTIDSRPEKDPK